MIKLALNKTTRGFDVPQYCVNCTKFGKLIFRKIVAVRCLILKLKCTKFDFGWGPWRSFRPLAGFKGFTSKGRKRMEKELGEELKGIRGKGGRQRRKGIAHALFSA